MSKIFESNIYISIEVYNIINKGKDLFFNIKT